MLYKLLVIVHVLGGALWIGGHIVLVTVMLPMARREKSIAPVKAFETGFGKFGLTALVLQGLTGLWLASHWLGEWGSIFSSPTPTGHLVLTKLALLLVNFGLAGHAYHRVLPRLTYERLGGFAIHAWIVLVLSLLMAVAGVGIRLGGLF